MNPISNEQVQKSAILEEMAAADICMKTALKQAGPHMTKYRNFEHLNLIKSLDSIAKSGELQSKSSSSKINSDTNSSINRLMECQLCGNVSMDQEWN